jgi:hypothetical protein
MLVFVASDKGGTGRTVTSCNVAYRAALQGMDVAFLDFDFGSPTAGAVLQIGSVSHGTRSGFGMHSYLTGSCVQPDRVDVWTASDRASIRARPPGAGRLVLFPGDAGGGEFGITSDMVQRCAELFVRLEEEFVYTFVDLSAGRSYATELILAATAASELRNIPSRWLVFHRWTSQHIIAAAGLIYGAHGLLDTAAGHGHIREELQRAVRVVRTAVVDPRSDELAGLRPAQLSWLESLNEGMTRDAGRLGLGRTNLLGSVPHDPVLQWQEQLITDNDVLARRIANQQTVDAFVALAKRIGDDAAWEGL